MPPSKHNDNFNEVLERMWKELRLNALTEFSSEFTYVLSPFPFGTCSVIRTIKFKYGKDIVTLFSPEFKKTSLDINGKLISYYNNIDYRDFYEEAKALVYRYIRLLRAIKNFYWKCQHKLYKPETGLMTKKLFKEYEDFLLIN